MSALAYGFLGGMIGFIVGVFFVSLVANNSSVDDYMQGFNQGEGVGFRNGFRAARKVYFLGENDDENDNDKEEAD